MYYITRLYSVVQTISLQQQFSGESLARFHWILILGVSLWCDWFFSNLQHCCKQGMMVGSTGEACYCIYHGRFWCSWSVSTGIVGVIIMINKLIKINFVFINLFEGLSPWLSYLLIPLTCLFYFNTSILINLIKWFTLQRKIIEISWEWKVSHFSCGACNYTFVFYFYALLFWVTLWKDYLIVK